MTAAALTSEAERAIAARRGGRKRAAAPISPPRPASRSIAIMAAPLALSFLASIKTTADASAVPPHYLPQGAELRELPQGHQLPGGPGDLRRQFRRRRADHHRRLHRARGAGGLRPRALRHARQGDRLSRAARADHDPLSGAADAALSRFRQGRPRQHAPRPRDRPHDPAAAVLDLPDAQQLRGDPARDRGGGDDRRLLGLAALDPHLPAARRARRSSPSRCSPSSPRGTSSSPR